MWLEDCRSVRQAEQTGRFHAMVSVVRHILVLFLLLNILLIMAATPAAGSTCREHRNGNEFETTFTLHLIGCSEEERTARAVQADRILKALKKGMGVDLSGVTVQGDLFLDELPLIDSEKALALPAADRATLQKLGAHSIRLIPAMLSIRDSVVEGKVGHRLKDGLLVVAGPVLLTNTRFEGVVDLSRTVFLGIVDCSSAVFLKESYFVQDRFQQPALFAQVTFGPHTRFHRAVFAGEATFHRARFSGLTEFLEASFERTANFAGSQFLSGTGFSGSRFNGKGDFTGAIFEGDVYFLFASFKGGARFRGAQFRSVADFSDVEMAGDHDLAGSVFTKPPQLPSSLQGELSRSMSPRSWISQYGVTLSLLLLSLALVVFLFRLK